MFNLPPVYNTLDETQWPVDATDVVGQLRLLQRGLHLHQRRSSFARLHQPAEHPASGRAGDAGVAAVAGWVGIEASTLSETAP